MKKSHINKWYRIFL